MKRRKCSFINALLGAEILPTGVLPVTAVFTEIKYGPVLLWQILFSYARLPALGVPLPVWKRRFVHPPDESAKGMEIFSMIRVSSHESSRINA